MEKREEWVPERNKSSSKPQNILDEKRGLVTKKFTISWKKRGKGVKGLRAWRTQRAGRGEERRSQGFEEYE